MRFRTKKIDAPKVSEPVRLTTRLTLLLWMGDICPLRNR